MVLPSQYSSWFDNLCLALGLADSRQAVENGGLSFDGGIIVAVNSSLTKVGTDSLLFQSPLGWMPKAAEPLMRRLLEIQLLVVGSMAPMFGLALHSDLLTVSVAIRPGEVNGNEAAEVVRGLVLLVRKLRAELNVDPKLRPGSSAKARSA